MYNIIGILGPSGSGKDSLLNEIIKQAQEENNGHRETKHFDFWVDTRRIDFDYLIHICAAFRRPRLPIFRRIH